MLEYGVKEIEDYVRSLGLDAYLVGGAVRDELLGRESKDADFLVPGVDAARAAGGARAARARSRSWSSRGRPVGMRLYPRDRVAPGARAGGDRVRAAAARASRPGPAGTTSRSSSTPDAGVEDDLARRDFTINAMARRLADGALVDPFGGRADLERRRAPHGLAAKLRRGPAPARPRAALRLPARARARRRDARADARGGRRRRARLGRAGRRRARGRRDGGALEAPARPRAAQGARARPRHGRARRAAARVRAGGRVRPGLEGPRDDRRRAHLRGRPGSRRRRHAACACGSRRSSTTSASPVRDGRTTPRSGRSSPPAILRRLRYPNDLRERVVRIVRLHVVPARRGRRRARPAGCSRGTATGSRSTCSTTGTRTSAGATSASRSPQKLERLAVFRETVEHELAQPAPARRPRRRRRRPDRDRLRARARARPALQTLLDEVVDQPALNRRETLLARAEELLHA